MSVEIWVVLVSLLVMSLCAYFTVRIELVLKERTRIRRLSWTGNQAFFKRYSFYGMVFSFRPVKSYWRDWTGGDK